VETSGKMDCIKLDQKVRICTLSRKMTCFCPFKNIIVL